MSAVVSKWCVEKVLCQEIWRFWEVHFVTCVSVARCGPVVVRHPEENCVSVISVHNASVHGISSLIHLPDACGKCRSGSNVYEFSALLSNETSGLPRTKR